MSSTRSDIVTHCVRPCVCPSVFPFFSFGVIVVLCCVKVFQWCFKNVFRVFEVSRMFPVSFKGGSVSSFKFQED